MDRPGNEDKCGNCQHKFGIHYGSYDGSVDGCTYTFRGQMDGDYPCDCKGFAMIYKYQNKGGWQPHPVGPGIR